ncbi:L,D-transpeptidase family protein [Verrucomicrobiota bacterium]
MTDFYVRNMNKTRRGGRFFFMVLLLAGIAGGAYWYFFLKPAAEPAAETAKPLPVAPAPAAPAPSTTPVATAPQPVVAPQPVAPVNPGIAGRLQQAIKLNGDGEFLQARTLLLELIKETLPKNVEQQAKEMIGDINIKLALSTRQSPEKKVYTVQSGDSFWKISRTLNTTTEYLQRANGLSPNALRPGQQLFYITGEFSIDVDLSEFTLTLLHNGTFFKQYKVGVGREERTPPGQYTIGPKIMHPDWDRRSKGLGIIPYGDPRNQLGECWMTLIPAGPGLPRDLGIHGTLKPETVGTNASAGCVRMRNYEVMELYAFILPGVQVNIRD